MKTHEYGLAGLCLAAACGAALAQNAHVHGAAELLVAVEKDHVAIELRSPLENLVGFEHAPRTDAQRAAMKAMTEKLKRPEALFRLPGAAACKAAPARIESPFDAAKPARSRGEHAELTAAYRFDCAGMGRLDAIEVAVFDAFPRTAEIKAQVVGPRGQAGARLTPKRRTLRLGPS